VNPLRCAVIGAGHLGRIHTRLAQSLPDVELVGVVDPLPEARARVAGEFGVRAFADLEELAEHIDAAIVAATTAQHFSVCRALLRRGIHVLVEKPITAAVDEADELIALARARQLVLQVGHVERFNPAWSAVAPLVRRPRYIEAVRSGSYTFRSTDVSVVLDLMIHDLDLTLSLVRSPVVEVDAVGVTVFGPHADMVHAHLRFANNCVASLNAARTSFQVQRTMHLITDRVYAGVDFASSVAKVVRPTQEVLTGRLDVHHLSAPEQDHLRQNLFTELLPMREIQVEKRNAILDEQQEFVNCIRHGHAPRVTGQQARDCLAVAERIEQSVAAKQRPHLRPHQTGSPWPATRRKAG
jgi:predicted dehydrogenase